MTRKALLAVCAGLPLAASASALPPILDSVPSDAMIVVTLPSVQQLDKDVQALSTAAKLPVPGMMGVQQLLQMQGLDQIIDSTRPSAVFIKGWTDVEEEPPFVALLPVKDYQQLVQMFMGEEQNGIHGLDLGGQKMYARPAGDGYAAIGPALEQVQQYEGGAGNAAAFKQRLGAEAEKVVDESMVSVIVNAEQSREVMDQFIATAKEQMEMNMGGMQMPQSAAGQWVREAVSRDAQMYVSGLSGGAKGASLDFVVRFKPDSYMANVVSGQGKAGTLLSRLPKQPYIVAFAMDVSTPGMHTFITDVAAKAKEDAAAQGAPNMLMDQVEQMNGFAYMIGAPVAIMVPGGLFANALAYISTDDPAGYIRAVQSTMASLEGESAEGLTYDTEWTENATTVGDTKAHSWTLRMTDDGTNPMAGQMQMIFGPAGLNGYIAPAEGGVVQTYAQNSMILGAALETAKGSQQGLNTDSLTGRVSETLPTGGRIVEGYIGAQSIYQTIAPLMAMGGGKLPPVGELPPVGFAVATGDGQAHARLFIPSPVIEAGAAIGMSMQGPQNFDEEEVDESGQPGF